MFSWFYVSDPMIYECISGFSVKNLLNKLKEDNVRVIQ